MATILRAYNEDNIKFDLDLFNEEAFLLDISAIESGDIGKVFGISSQTFSLPATDNNNAYFGNLDNLGASPATSFIKTLPCQVLQDGEAIFNGSIYLENVITDSKGDTIYNAVVVNEVVDFKYQIKDLTMSDLDWSDYVHTLNYTNISSSWDLNLFNGDVVYPLAEYGVEQNDLGNDTLLVNGGGLHMFTNQNYPLKTIDFKPAIRVRTILDRIFAKTNFTYTSSFFDDAYMDSVYVLATQDESRNSGAFVSPVSQSFSAYNNTTQNLTPNSIPKKLLFNTEFYDYSNTWDTTNSEFSPDVNGDYSFKFGLPFQITNQNSFSARQITFYLFINGAPSINVPPINFLYSNVGVYGTSATFNGIAYGNFNNVTLNAGDAVTLYAKFSPALSIPSTEVCTFNGLSAGRFQMYQGAMSATGFDVNLGKCFNSDEKITDFLNGIVEKFNLVFVPKKGESNVISIETFNDWRDAGQIVDWTDKVDRSVKWNIRHPIQNNPRDLYFSDVADKDYFNAYYTDILGKAIFGDYNYLSESDLADGERRIGKYFAPTPMRFIEGTQDFIVPQIYTAGNVGDVKKRFVFKPRLLHYLGKYDNSQLFDISAILPPFSGQNGTWWFENDAGTSVSQSQYPVFHHVNELPATSASLDLHFGNLNHMEYHQEYVNAETPKDAFYTYWAEYVNELYDVDSRLLTCNIVLKPTDIPNIELNDKVFIDGHYYRINKISGANLTNEQSTQVELVKVLNRKLKYPRRRIAVGDFGGNDYSDVVVKTLDNGGRVEYVDFETDAPITDANLLSQASSRDGFRYFSGSNEVVWKQERTNIPTSNVSNGINFIDDRAVNVRVDGSGNNIGGYIQNSTIVGSNNNLLDGVNNINIFGDNVELSGSVNKAFVVNQTGSVLITDTQDIIALNPVRPINGYNNNKVVIGNVLNQGAQYETYNVIEASAGFVYHLTGSGVQDRFHHHFTWSGSNGTATIYIEDSTQPEYDGLLQRFTTDASLDASKAIYLTPVSGTIDGSAEEPLNKPYDGMTAEVINGQWIVVQRKG